MQVIGLCRFSYPAEGGFQVEHADIAARRAYLYDPARIEERFRTLEAITLPALRVQTDPDFTFAILVDEALPAPLAERLLGLVADMPQAALVARPPGPHRKVCQDVLNAARSNRAAPCIQFRLDDDDAVAIDFVARLRADAHRVAPLVATERSVILDYNRGVILAPSADGLRGEDCVLHSYPMGMGMVVAGGVGQSIMNFAHGKVGQFMPVVSFTDSVMYVRGHNDFNDSRQKAHVKPLRLPAATPALLETLQTRFAISEARVRAVFSGHGQAASRARA